MEEAEEAYQKGDSKLIYKMIKKVTIERSAYLSIEIKDKDGSMLYDNDAISRRWRECCAELFGRPDKVTQSLEKGNEEPEVLESKTEVAIKKQKNGGAMGIDEIPSEVMKAGGSAVVR